MNKTNYGLVFAGGGGKGAYQIGVWKALLELEVANQITAVSGASVGALNTALLGAGDYERAEQVWLDIKPSQFLDFNENSDFRAKDQRGIFSREGLIQIMDENLDFNKVRESPLTLYANASRMIDGQLAAEYFMLNGRSDWELKEILLASSALPAIYEPEEIEGNWYQDGGLKDNIPVLPLLMDGYEHIIIVTLGKYRENFREKYPQAKLFVITPSKGLGGFLDGTLDFSGAGAKKRLEIGYEDGMRELVNLHLM